MTTINDIADLVKILREDPNWAEAVRSVLLSQELLNLPKEVAALANAFREYAEATNRRLDALEAGQQRLEAGQQRLEENVQRLEAGQQRLEGNVQRLEGNVQRLEAGQAYLFDTVNAMRGELGNLSGSFFQRCAANFAERIARRDFDLTQTAIIHQADTAQGSKLRTILNDAVDHSDGALTEDDAIAVEEADAVVEGTDSDGEKTYLLAEASITVANEDVVSAKRKASLLERATGVTTTPVVIGETITPEAATATLAETESVTFVQLLPRRAQVQPPQTQ